MITNNEQAKDRDKLTLGLSLFIAICLIILFCAISVAVAKSLNNISDAQEARYMSLPSLEDDNTSNLLL